MAEPAVPSKQPNAVQRVVQRLLGITGTEVASPVARSEIVSVVPRSVNQRMIGWNAGLPNGSIIVPQDTVKQSGIMPLRGEAPTDYQRTGTTVRIRGWERHPIVNACVREILNIASAVPLQAYLKNPNDATDITVLGPNHPLQRLMDAPSAFLSAQRYRAITIGHYLVYGNTMTFLERKPVMTPGGDPGLPLSLRIIHPEDLSSVYVNVKGYPLWYLWRDNLGYTHTSPVTDILHARDYNMHGLVFGYPRAAAAINDIVGDTEASEYVRQIVTNDGWTSLVFVANEEMTQDEAIIAEARWKEKMVERGGRGSARFVGGVKEVKELGFSLRDLEFPDLRRVSREDICASFGVDARMVGVTSAIRDAGLSGTQYVEARRRLVAQTVEPLMRAFESELNQWLAPEFGADVYLRFDPLSLQALTESEEETSIRVVREVAAGLRSVEEGRAALNLPEEFEEDDLLAMSSTVNMIPAALAVQPEPPPGPGPAALHPETGLPIKGTEQPPAPAKEPPRVPVPLTPVGAGEGAPESEADVGTQSGSDGEDGAGGDLAATAGKDPNRPLDPPSITDGAVDMAKKRALSHGVLTRGVILTQQQRTDLWRAFDARGVAEEAPYKRAALMLFGEERSDVAKLFDRLNRSARSARFNENHDEHTGEFTSGDGGSFGKSPVLGMTQSEYESVASAAHASAKKLIADGASEKAAFADTVAKVVAWAAANGIPTGGGKDARKVAKAIWNSEAFKPLVESLTEEGRSWIRFNPNHDDHGKFDFGDGKPGPDTHGDGKPPGGEPAPSSSSTTDAPIGDPAIVGKSPADLGWPTTVDGVDISGEKALTGVDTPAVLAARASVRGQEPTSLLTGRDAMREEAVKLAYGEGATNKDKIADIVIGGPGAGKSTAVADKIAASHGSLVVDADAIKPHLDGYAGGRGAGVVHEESAILAEGPLLGRAIANGDNIVMPRVGANAAGIENIASTLAAAGYTVNLHYVDVPIREQVNRVMARFGSSGRFVDPNYVVNTVDSKPGRTFAALKDSPIFSNAYFTDNSGKTAITHKVRMVTRASDHPLTPKSIDTTTMYAALGRFAPPWPRPAAPAPIPEIDEDGVCEAALALMFPDAPTRSTHLRFNENHDEHTGEFLGGDTREQGHAAYQSVITEYEKTHEPYRGQYRRAARLSVHPDGRRASQEDRDAALAHAALLNVRRIYAVGGEARQRWQERFTPLIGGTYTRGADRVAAGLTGRSSPAPKLNAPRVPPKKALAPFDFTMANPSVEAAVVGRAERLAAYVGDETATQITDTIEVGLHAGMTIKDIADLINEVVFSDTATEARAMRIARTETIGALNHGEFQTAEESFAVEGKEWLTQGDDRVRDSHAACESEGVVPLGDQFDSNGLMYPGDPDGDGEDVINCFLPGTLVSGSVVAAMRSWYRGPAVELVTKSGRRLSVTPNHPVMTAQGLRAAGLLGEGDQLLRDCREIWRTTSDAHDDECPARVEDVFAALRKIATPERRHLRRDDLHGDALWSDGEIKIVRPHRLLLDDGETDGAQQAGERVFVQESAVQPLHVSLGALDLRRERVDTAAPRVPRGGALTLDLPGVALQGRPFHSLGVAPSAHLHAAFAETANQHRTTEAGFVSQLLQRHASLVALDEIVEVRHFDYVGHVFDLESVSPNLLVGDGIVNSNCRCTMLYYDSLPAQ